MNMPEKTTPCPLCGNTQNLIAHLHDTNFHSEDVIYWTGDSWYCYREVVPLTNILEEEE
jgi:C4-type Zn-finger protein